MDAIPHALWPDSLLRASKDTAHPQRQLFHPPRHPSAAHKAQLPRRKESALSILCKLLLRSTEPWPPASGTTDASTLGQPCDRNPQLTLPHSSHPGAHPSHFALGSRFLDGEQINNPRRSRRYSFSTSTWLGTGGWKVHR